VRCASIQVTLSRRHWHQYQVGPGGSEAVLSESVSFGEISFSGMLPTEGSSAAEIQALIAEPRGTGWLPKFRKAVNVDTRKVVKA
jgi:hypothetical protein